MDSQHFIVRRDDLSKHETVAAPRETLAEGSVEFRVDRFGFTCNNVFYAKAGDSLLYWRFFPTPQPGWGRIPVWGFATVVRSRMPAVPVGERYYGYYPMSSHLIVQPKRFDEAGFYDSTPHRRNLNAVYNQYIRTTHDPHYRPDTEFQQVVLRPLFATSYFLADYLRENDFFAADTVMVSSASSKLALGIAYMLGADRKRDRRTLIGLTSARNAGLVSGLGLYDLVVSYDDIAALPAARRGLLIDIAGGSTVRGAIHRRLAGGLKYLIAVGSTHGPRECGPDELPGTEPIEFFAPAWMKHRSQQWTVLGSQQRLAEAWNSFLIPLQDAAHHWMTVASCIGPEAVGRTYDEVLANHARPDHGYGLSL